jgi:hypothetical protein
VLPLATIRRCLVAKSVTTTLQQAPSADPTPSQGRTVNQGTFNNLQCNNLTYWWLKTKLFRAESLTRLAMGFDGFKVQIQKIVS